MEDFIRPDNTLEDFEADDIVLYVSMPNNVKTLKTVMEKNNELGKVVSLTTETLFIRYSNPECTELAFNGQSTNPKDLINLTKEFNRHLNN